MNTDHKSRAVSERDAQALAGAANAFASPQRSLGTLDASSAAAVIAAAADVALILDQQGVIQDVACSGEELSLEGCRKWIGQRWVETVTADTRAKVEALIRDASQAGPYKWRQVNHPSVRGPDVPILYSALQLGKDGRVIAFGRDLRATATLQQRLVEAQQSMERDYWRLRHAETRYRLLFEMSSEAVLVVDSRNMKIIEANPAVGKLLGRTDERYVGVQFPEGFDDDSTKAIEAMLATVRAGGASGDITVRLADSTREFSVSASFFRQDQSSQFLVRFAPIRENTHQVAVPQAILKVVDGAPDGFVVTDLQGLVLSANRAFVDMAQLTSEEQVRGESLDRWLGRSSVDFNVLIANLRQHGTVRLFATALHGNHGVTTDVEISAVAVLNGALPCFGFAIRDIGRRLTGDARQARELPRSAEQLTELVGRVSLKDLVGETTDLIEKLCIEAALELTNDNRAAAAEMLGLSRQSLYVKMRRYGLGDLPPELDE